MQKEARDEILRDMATAYLNYEDDGSAEIMGRVQAAMQAALSELEKTHIITPSKCLYNRKDNCESL